MAILRAVLLLIVMLASTWPVWSGEIVKKIEIDGLERTKPRVILRELPFTTGSEWKEGDATEGERLLRNLGLFSEVRIMPPDANGKVKVFAKEQWSLWLLPEASRKDGGASSAGLALTDYNMWGLNHHLRLASRWDTGKNFTGNNGNSYQASYLWRRVADSKLSLDASLNTGRSIFDVFQLGSLASSYVLETRDWSVGVGYGFGDVPGEGWDVRFNVDSSDSNYKLKAGAFQPDVQDRRRNGIGFQASFRRIDNHITWITGTQFNYSISFAEKMFGSTINAVRQNASWINYMPIGGQKTLNYRFAAGWVAGNVLRDGLFDVGNRNNIRGYYPGDVQGSAYIYGTVESRIPVTYGSNLQWVTFVDVGQVTRDGKRALNKSVIAGIGTGARWTLRWLVNGTFSADIAYGTALHRWRVHLGTGQDF